MLRLAIFNLLFPLVLTKFFKSELFSCLPKVDHVIKSCKEPIYENQIKINLLCNVARSEILAGNSFIVSCNVTST